MSVSVLLGLALTYPEVFLFRCLLYTTFSSLPISPSSSSSQANGTDKARLSSLVGRLAHSVILSFAICCRTWSLQVGLRGATSSIPQDHGVLLFTIVDEVDDGLVLSVMDDDWKLRGARR